MNGHAVVIGGGIGGLLAGQALASRFDRVSLFERDRYPSETRSDAPPARRGVPQSRCLHLLMAAGATAFDQLTPGWREELVALGAVPFDVSSDAAVRLSTGWLPRAPSGITSYASSRALLERVLRRRLSRISNVNIREGQKVAGLLGSRSGERVTGVRTADSGSSGAESVVADLVVDASGKGSTLPGWLGRLPGLRSHLEELVVESGTQYVSRWFQLEPCDAPDWHCLSIAPAAAGHYRSAMMLRAEGNHWGVVLLAPARELLPFDDTAFLDFTSMLGDGELRDALRRARPVSPIYYYGFTSSRIRRYDRVTPWPDGLVALGDAVCALDPYFGLGMTATARGAVLLGEFLDRQRDPIVAGSGFQKDLAALNIEPWQLVTGRDADGRRLDRDAAYIARLYDAAPSSLGIAHALLAVQHLLRPVDSLMEFPAG
jgi:2-polyprenyl-6-methoxyphenol hydroxylase-like FAD-dependent oxidoreductase